MPAAERNLGHAVCVSADAMAGRIWVQPYLLRQSQAEGWDPRRKTKAKTKQKLTKSWFSLLGLFYVALDNDYPMSKESCK